MNFYHTVNNNTNNNRSIHMMLIHESHVFELRSETKFEVCDPSSFLTLLMQ